MDDITAVAKACGAVDYSPPPMRAVRGLSFTYEQLDAFITTVLELNAQAGGVAVRVHQVNAPASTDASSPAVRKAEDKLTESVSCIAARTALKESDQ